MFLWLVVKGRQLYKPETCLEERGLQDILLFHVINEREHGEGVRLARYSPLLSLEYFCAAEPSQQSECPICQRCPGNVNRRRRQIDRENIRYLSRT
jgi:hypothetical protein